MIGQIDAHDRAGRPDLEEDTCPEAGCQRWRGRCASAPSSKPRSCRAEAPRRRVTRPAGRRRDGLAARAAAHGRRGRRVGGARRVHDAQFARGERNEVSDAHGPGRAGGRDRRRPRGHDRGLPARAQRGTGAAVRGPRPDRRPVLDRPRLRRRPDRGARRRVHRHPARPPARPGHRTRPAARRPVAGGRARRDLAELDQRRLLRLLRQVLRPAGPDHDRGQGGGPAGGVSAAAARLPTWPTPTAR